ncbi:uncharacterized protein LOC129598603 [Paramacrobiotus metropolitanus]|uniref:uncharacterized protein LOC129598603 n=1 Tax=Paramacrobiotus metropolitanus TaxID=2943436 RepID=UPI0024462D93|nr:uncharacterized protein LOC129598603 [Paramacrobiotus metropolitanus]
MQHDVHVASMTYATVAFSGSVLVDPTVAYIRDPMTNAKKVATAAGGPTDTSTGMVSCLKALPQNQFQKAQLTIVQIPVNAAFGFVVDHDNIQDLPLRALQQTLDSGYTGPKYYHQLSARRCLFNINFVGTVVPDVLNSAPLTFRAIRNVITKYLLPRDARPLCPIPDTHLGDRVIQHYNMSEHDRRKPFSDKFYRPASDAIQGYPAAKEALMYAKHAWPSGPSVQLIRTIYDSHYKGWGAFHAMELAYIFGQWQLFPGEKYDPRLTVSYRSMLSQVAHKGRMDGPAFLQSNSAYGVNELGLDGQWSASTYDLAGMLNYWQDIANQPCPGAFK